MSQTFQPGTLTVVSPLYGWHGHVDEDLPIGREDGGCASGIGLRPCRHPAGAVSKESILRQLGSSHRARREVRVAAVDDRDRLAQHETSLESQRCAAAVQDRLAEDLRSDFLLFLGQQLERHAARTVRRRRGTLD